MCDDKSGIVLSTSNFHYLVDRKVYQHGQDEAVQIIYIL